MKKPAPRRQLLETIRAALDCSGHFGEVKLVQTKEDRKMGFCLGKNAIAICGQCVDRMREAIGLEPGEDVHQAYGYWKLVKEADKSEPSTRKNRKK